MEKLWRKEGSLYYFIGNQRSKEWFEARKNRLTASNVAAATGRANYGRTDVDIVEETAMAIRGEIDKTVVNEAQQQGINYEDAIREEYERRNNVAISELGFVFDERRPYLGVSPDGLVGDDGLIEIKCPQKMYQRLLGVAEGKVKPFYLKNQVPSYIFPSHYDQMQTQMAVLGRKWCDYVVYCPADQIYLQHRVPFNRAHWTMLSKLIDEFIDEHLKTMPVFTPEID